MIIKYFHVVKIFLISCLFYNIYRMCVPANVSLLFSKIITDNSYIWLARKSFSKYMYPYISRTLWCLQYLEICSFKKTCIPANLSWAKCMRFSSSEYLDFKICSADFLTLPHVQLYIYLICSLITWKRKSLQDANFTKLECYGTQVGIYVSSTYI